MARAHAPSRLAAARPGPVWGLRRLLAVGGLLGRGPPDRGLRQADGGATMTLTQPVPPTALERRLLPVAKGQRATPHGHNSRRIGQACYDGPEVHRSHADPTDALVAHAHARYNSHELCLPLDRYLRRRCPSVHATGSVACLHRHTIVASTLCMLRWGKMGKRSALMLASSTNDKASEAR